MSWYKTKAFKALITAFDAASVNWNFIHGLLLNAIYGGRIDNDFDIRVLNAYLREFFNDSVLNKGRDFGPGLTLPSSESYSEYLELVHKLLDFDKPSYFGLPDNIERSWQKITSSQIIDQLKIISHSARSKNFDIKSWQQNLSPVLNLWKKLNQNVGLIETKLSNVPTNPANDPVLNFLSKDFRHGIKLVQNIHKNLAGISKVIRGIILPNAETIRVAEALLSHQTPTEWQTIWKGPENPLKYLRTVVSKATNLQKMSQKTSSDFLIQEELDLSEFFQMKTFLKAVKQLTARKTKVALDELEVCCDWKGGLKNAKISFRAKNLQLEGASFDGRTLVHTTAESPSVTTAPPLTIAFVNKESLDLDKNEKGVIFPVYRTSERDELVMTLRVPCGGYPDEWFKAGAAFFFKD